MSCKFDTSRSKNGCAVAPVALVAPVAPVATVAPVAPFTPDEPVGFNRDKKVL